MCNRMARILLWSILVCESSSFVVTPLHAGSDGLLRRHHKHGPLAESNSNNKNNMNDNSNALSQMPDSGTHDELMYTLGVNLARQLGDVRPLVESPQEMSLVAKGLLDTVIGRLNETDQRTLLARRGQELNQLIVTRANAIKEQLSAAGKEMLQTMAKTEGAITLPSGVVVHVLEHGPEGKGQGVRPTKASTVKIQYHGTLADGTVFDSTIGGEPVVFPLANVIPGWCEGVQKMHEGETAMVGIPPALGYGDKGTPDGRIPGDSTLFFKIQLLEVMTAGIGGGPSLLGVDGKKLKSSTSGGGGGLLGANGKPL